MRMVSRLALVLLVVVTAACTTASYGGNSVTVGAGATQGGDKKAGAVVFSNNCASCHGAQGAGSSVGPSLGDESRRMDFETVASWVKDPEPPMPKLYPGALNAQQVRDVAAYVQTL